MLRSIYGSNFNFYNFMHIYKIKIDTYIIILKNLSYEKQPLRDPNIDILNIKQDELRPTTFKDF